MKKVEKIISVIVLIACTFNLLTLNVFAMNDDGSKQDETVKLLMANVTEETTDDGYVISCDLVQEKTDNERIIGWVVVGCAQFKLELLPGNGIGFISWKFSLTNGDVIKRVRATFVVEKNTLLFDPNIYKTNVDKIYDPAEYTTIKADQISFRVEESDLPSNQKIRFKWSGVTVTGALNGYSVESGNVTGTVADF